MIVRAWLVDVDIGKALSNDAKKIATPSEGERGDSNGLMEQEKTEATEK